MFNERQVDQAISALADELRRSNPAWRILGGEAWIEGTGVTLDLRNLTLATLIATLPDDEQEKAKTRTGLGRFASYDPELTGVKQATP